MTWPTIRAKKPIAQMMIRITAMETNIRNEGRVENDDIFPRKTHRSGIARSINSSNRGTVNAISPCPGL